MPLVGVGVGAAHSARTSRAGVFDLDTARECVGGSEQILKEVIDAFFEESPMLMEQIRQAISDGDVGELRRAAHTLKGTVAVFGANFARQAAWRLEKMGRDADLTDAEAACVELQQRVGELHSALLEQMNSQAAK
jgi:HPt (histidine-containing phosphotransfer) domain-containing protein